MVRACGGAASANSEIDTNLFRKISYTAGTLEQFPSN